MKTISKQFDIPVKYTCDVAVIGGGPAGFCAAVAAARNGADTLLVERNGSGGGMATAGLVGPFMTSYSKSGDRMIIRGMFEEVVQRLMAKDGAVHPEDCRLGDQITGYHFRGHDHCGAFDPEAMKLVVDDMLTEAGVKVLYHTTFVAPLMEGQRVQGVIVVSKSGMAAIRARVVIDCSGDADVAYHALTDALLGAAAMGDIGRHFPDTDPKYKGADSGKLLDHVMELIWEKGYVVGNVDVTIIAQRPKLKDYIEQMRENVARRLNVDIDCVNVKATTTEKLGFEGEGLGISTHAVACIEKA